MRLRLRFSLKTLLLVATALCLLLGWGLAESLQRRRIESEARDVVAALGGTIQNRGWSVASQYRDGWIARTLGWEVFPRPLWHVDLSGKRVSKADLAKLARCTWIRRLDLSGAPIGDAELAAASAIPNLIVLRIDNTQVTDAGLKALHDQRFLGFLDVSNSKVTYDGLEDLDQALGVPRLAPALVLSQAAFPGVAIHPGSSFLPEPPGDMGGHYLSAGPVHHMHITSGAGFDPKWWDDLRHLSDLRDLTGSFAKRRFPGFENLAQFKELRRLTLDGGRLTDDDLAVIAKLAKLKYLQLVGWNEFSDGAALQFGVNNTIEHLELSGLTTTVEMTAKLGGLRALKVLTLTAWEKGPDGSYENLSQDQIQRSAAALKRLKDLPRLRSVRLSGNVFTDEALLALGEVKQLTQIVFDEKFATDAGVAKLKALLPDCKVMTRPISDTIDLD